MTPFSPTRALRDGAVLLLLAAATAGVLAQAPVSRDELRACMDSEAAIAAQRAAFEKRQAENTQEMASMRAEGQVMAEEEKRLKEAGEISDSPKVLRFQERVKAFNERIKAGRGHMVAANADLDALNAAVVAHNARCGAISFRPEDKAAILQERAAASGK